jgi:hypothetical protein
MGIRAGTNQQIEQKDQTMKITSSCLPLLLNQASKPLELRIRAATHQMLGAREDGELGKCLTLLYENCGDVRAAFLNLESVLLSKIIYPNACGRSHGSSRRRK